MDDTNLTVGIARVGTGFQNGHVQNVKLLSQGSVVMEKSCISAENVEVIAIVNMETTRVTVWNVKG